MLKYPVSTVVTIPFGTINYSELFIHGTDNIISFSMALFGWFIQPFVPQMGHNIHLFVSVLFVYCE